MMQLNLSQLCATLGMPTGFLKGQLSSQQIADIVIDSRKVTSNTIFVALQGESLDGHDFARQAEEQGAIAIIAEKELANLTIPVLVVDSSRLALAKIASFYRQQFQIPVIGITGSCGKTSTKALTAAVLGIKGAVLATEGTLNNDLGVPLTLFRLRPEHQFAVIEMGANHMGEIAYLAEIAKPTVAMITNTGPVHLEGFGSLEGVQKAKGEIYQALAPGAVAIVNTEDAGVTYWQTLLQQQQVLYFGLNEKADIFASDIKVNETLMPSFTLHIESQATTVNLPLLGEHQVMNALAAAAAGFSQGLSLAEIKQGLEAAQAVAQRGIMRQGFQGIKILDDSYNANPKAFRAAIDMLMAIQGVAKRIVVMGDMGELGSEVQVGHESVGHYACTKGVDAFYCVGKLTPFAAAAFGQNAFHFGTQEELVNALKAIANDQTCILVKGSKSSHMNDVVAALV